MSLIDNQFPLPFSTVKVQISLPIINYLRMILGQHRGTSNVNNWINKIWVLSGRSSHDNNSDQNVYFLVFISLQLFGRFLVRWASSVSTQNLGPSNRRLRCENWWCVVTVRQPVRESFKYRVHRRNFFFYELLYDVILLFPSVLSPFAV